MGGGRGERGECSDVISIEVILSDAWKIVIYLLGKVVTATNGGLDSAGCSYFEAHFIPAQNHSGVRRGPNAGGSVFVWRLFFVCAPERCALLLLAGL